MKDETSGLTNSINNVDYLIIPQLVMKFIAFYITRDLIAIFA